MHDCTEDEITLRDLYLILRRRAAWIVGLPLVLAGLAFAVSKWMPPTYESEAVFSLGASKHAAALVEGLKARMGTEAFAKRLGASGEVDWAKVQFDAKKGYLKLIARAKRADEVKSRAEALVRVTIEDFRASLTQAKRVELEGERERLRGELRALEAQRQALRKALTSRGSRDAGDVQDGAVQTTLEALGVDPRVARSGDPARAYLELELAKVEASIASKRARLEQVEGWLKDEASLAKLVESELPLQLVAPPGLPLKPVAPRVLLNTALAFVLGLMLAVFGAFLQAALEPKEEEALAEKPPAVSG